jgi:hypothetical protein
MRFTTPTVELRTTIDAELAELAERTISAGSAVSVLIHGYSGNEVGAALQGVPRS